ncbi:MAG: CAP domain-containing protein [Alphaproteobacteria bacterium]|nr:CAP domain-containing protein [Alphaproteobacteria bacterium]
MMRRRFVLAGGLAAAALSACSSFVPQGATGPAATTRELFLKKINETRVANGVKPLHYDTRLEAAALRQAELMANTDSIAHELGESLRSRVSAAGYHEAVAENLAGGQTTLEDAIAGWLESPSHRRAMLHPYFTEVGFAVVSRPETRWKVFWATIYGGETEQFLAMPV